MGVADEDHIHPHHPWHQPSRKQAINTMVQKVPSGWAEGALRNSSCVACSRGGGGGWRGGSPTTPQEGVLGDNCWQARDPATFSLMRLQPPLYSDAQELWIVQRQQRGREGRAEAHPPSSLCSHLAEELGRDTSRSF